MKYYLLYELALFLISIVDYYSLRMKCIKTFYYLKVTSLNPIVKYPKMQITFQGKNYVINLAFLWM